MNALVPQNFGPLSTRFAGQAISDEFAAGIEASFGMIGYRGKVWSIRFRGEEKPLMREDGDGARSSIEAIFVQSALHKSKVWYEQGWVDGSTAAPDCFSNNGVTPDPRSPKKQCAACAGCEKNKFGSHPTGKGKACADSKRTVVVPLGDIENEMYGGPMFLRVPAASLNDLAMYAQAWAQKGFPLYGIGTRISFDAKESYPKFQFSAIRPLDDDEAGKIMELRGSPMVKRILAEGSETTQAVPVAAAEPQFEQAPKPAAPQASATAMPMTAVITAVGDAGAKATGFGPVKPVTLEVKPVAVASPSTVAQVKSPEEMNKAFEASLDDKLAAFLPAA